MAAKKPLVSVLMPFYDDGRERTRAYMSEAISSALGQKFKDAEIVLVVSGAKDFARKQARRSGRIRVFYSGRKGGYDSGLAAKVRGLARARNLGVEKSRGEFIAFFDADDVSEPSRLGKQLEYMGGHPEVGVVGSAMTLIDARGVQIGERRSFENDKDIRRNLIQFNTIPQPTVMVRRKLVLAAGGYSESEIAEDYDLWVRLAKLSQFHNVQQRLVRYRVHPLGGATRVRLALYSGSLKVKLRAMRAMGILPGPKDIAVNLLQFASLFFPDDVRRTLLEKIRGKVLIGSRSPT